MSADDESDFKILKEWLITQPHLPQDISDLLLRRYVHTCGTLDEAKSALDAAYTLRSATPEIFSNRDPQDKRLQETFRIMDIVPLKKRTPDNHEVFLHGFRYPNTADTFDYPDTIKLFFMIQDLLFKEDAPFSNGEITIYNVAHLSMKYLGKVSIPAIKTYFTYMQKGCPIIGKQIHVINCPTYIEAFWTVVKPFTSKKDRNMIRFHKPNSDTLFNFVPKDMLPLEFGGTDGSIDVHRSEWKQKLEAERDYFLNEKQWSIDESKRPSLLK